jgi:hypothetical protein
VSRQFPPVVRVVVALRALQEDRRRIDLGIDSVNVLHVGLYLVHVRTVEAAVAAPIKAILDVQGFLFKIKRSFHEPYS